MELKIKTLKVQALLILSLGIFVLDSITHWEIAFPMLYTGILFFIAPEIPVRKLAWLTTTYVMLSIASFIITTGKGNFASGIANLALCILTLCMVGFLLAKNEAAKRRKMQSGKRLTDIEFKNIDGFALAIAHEINQPLTVCLSSADAAERWLKRTPANVSKALASLDRISLAAARAEKIVSRIRSISKGEDAVKAVFNFSDVLAEALDLLAENIAQNNIRVSLKTLSDKTLVFADSLQIEQVVINLLKNAVEASSDDSKRPLRAIDIIVKKEANFLSCSITDYGPGLDAKMKAHLFEPFYTQKPNGLGIGLSFSSFLAQANGGTLSLEENSSSAATTFVLRVPTAATSGNHP